MISLLQSPGEIVGSLFSAKSFCRYALSSKQVNAGDLGSLCGKSSLRCALQDLNEKSSIIIAAFNNSMW